MDRHNIDLSAKQSRLRARTNCASLARPITAAPFDHSWRNEPCYIIAGGPSLLNFDFSLISNKHTIGINKAFIKYPCTINYSMDVKFYNYVSTPVASDIKRNTVHDAWKKYTGIKAVLAGISKRSRFDDSVYVVKRLSKMMLSFDLASGIYGGSNSGVGALMLAVALGCKEIYFLGLDMSIDMTTSATHWHNGYQGQTIENMKLRFERYKNEFTLLAPIIKSAGVRVVNLNPNSSLDCFEKANISLLTGATNE